VGVIGHLCNHQAVLYRATVTRDALGDAVETWVAQPSPEGMNCRPHQAWSGTLQDHGPGEQQGARRQWFLVPEEWAPQERDVLRVTCGPEAPVLLRIESVVPTTDRVRPHHIEVNVEVWHGVVS